MTPDESRRQMVAALTAERFTPGPGSFGAGARAHIELAKAEAEAVARTRHLRIIHEEKRA